MAETVHGSALLVGATAVLIRGPAGAGKSNFVRALIDAAGAGNLAFARLVGDDRVHLEACHGRLLVRPAAALAGMMEIRGLGIVHMPFEPVAVVGLVADLAVPDAERMPATADRETLICGVRVPRVAIAPGIDPLIPVLASARWILNLGKEGLRCLPVGQK